MSAFDPKQTFIPDNCCHAKRRSAQIALVENFAAQAVIAIENTRLLNELRQRTDDLTESLQQQTATSEVLGVISEFPGELKPVFNAVLENATRLCEATFGTLYRFENGAFWVTALRNAPPEFAAFLQSGHCADRLPCLLLTQSGHWSIRSRGRGCKVSQPLLINSSKMRTCDTNKGGTIAVTM